jgi:hypothetical protein
LGCRKRRKLKLAGGLSFRNMNKNKTPIIGVLFLYYFLVSAHYLPIRNTFVLHLGQVP